MPVRMVTSCSDETFGHLFIIKAYKSIPYTGRVKQWFIQYQVPNVSDYSTAIKTFCDLKVSDCNRYSSWVLKPEVIDEICTDNTGVPKDAHFILIG